MRKIISILILLLTYKTIIASYNLTYSDKQFSYTLTVDSVLSGDNVNYDCVVKTISVTRLPDRKLIQTITPGENYASCGLPADQLFFIEDINFDGYNDIRLLQFLPASPNLPYYFWTYNPKTLQFIQDTTLENITSPEFDQKTKTIFSAWRDGCCKYGSATYTYENGKITLIQQMEVPTETEQNTTSNFRVLSEAETQTVFPEQIQRKLNIPFHIYKAYEFNDKLGKHYLVLTENNYSPNGENDSIKAYNIRFNNSEFKVDWTCSDFITINKNDSTERFSIWFWFKYIELTDLDSDGLIDPIVVYGTTGINGTDDGKIKILTYYKGAKRAIRHQNGVLDFERETRVDSLFYELPEPVQEKVKAIMTKITENENVIFPYGWQTAIKNKELKFKETHE